MFPRIDELQPIWPIARKREGVVSCMVLWRSILDNRLDNHFFERPPKVSKRPYCASPDLAREF